jgi:hypothetical protein
MPEVGSQPSLIAKQQDQHQPDPEQRHGIGDDARPRYQVVLPGAHPDRAQQPEQDAEATEKHRVVPISSSVAEQRARISGNTALALRKE